MTEAKKETIYADKLKNTDISSLEKATKNINDDLVEPVSVETKELLQKLDKRILRLMDLIYICSLLGRVDIGREVTKPTSYFDNSVFLVISLTTYVSKGNLVCFTV